MGKSSGGVRNAGIRVGMINVTARGATEEGYSAKMLRNIVGIEQEYRLNKDETIHIFTPDGDLIKSIGGKGASVRGNIYDIPEGAILTHNHPRSLGSKGILRIGNSFSDTDLYTMVARNAKEMRAVTPTYTFSMKRPKNGWGVKSKTQLVRAYKKAYREVDYELRSYLHKHKYSQEAFDRANSIFYHKVNTKVAKKFGWIYTKKKG